MQEVEDADACKCLCDDVGEEVGCRTTVKWLESCRNVAELSDCVDDDEDVGGLEVVRVPEEHPRCELSVHVLKVGLRYSESSKMRDNTYCRCRSCPSCRPRRTYSSWFCLLMFPPASTASIAKRAGTVAVGRRSLQSHMGMERMLQGSCCEYRACSASRTCHIAVLRSRRGTMLARGSAL